jgi:death-on-curing protein
VPLLYLTLDQAVEVHRKTVEVSGGGSVGSLDLSKLESVLCHIQNDDYYPNFEDKLTHLFFCSNKFHCFEDGNKRIAIALGAQFLILNGYVFVARRFIEEMENISYHVAAGKIDKELLHEIICAVIYDDMENETLKFKILRAISEDQNP